MTPRLLVAAASFAVAACVAWFAYERMRPEAPSVRIVDTSAEIERLLSARAADERGGTVAEESYPPPFRMEALDEETVATFFPSLKSKLWVYDPDCYVRRVSSQEPRFNRLRAHPDGGWTQGTNDYGMREDEDVAREQPDLRIVVTGDSHTDGICNHSESLANVLESLLAESRPDEQIESLNAGGGGYTLHNYVGTYRRLRELDPDAFIVVVYGGNDFSGAMLLQRYFHRRAPARMGPLAIDFTSLLSPGVKSLAPQEFQQAIYFANNPGDEELAVDLVCSFSVELERSCRADGVDLLLVYLPPPTRGQGELYDKTRRRFLDESRVGEVDLGVSDRIADRWLAFLDERGIARLDLRPAFGSAEELLYWRSDHHLNVAGHRLAGELLFEAIRARREE